MNKAYKPMKSRCRASFAAGLVEEPRLGKIDKENEVLHDVQITLEGEALGHDVWLDRSFCESVVEAGNAMGDAGVKCRFGHPSMCSDALGTYLGRAKNFRAVDLKRKDGTPACGVLADIYIAPESHSAPAGDLGKWVMEAAENSPDTFGQSIVFTYSDMKVKDADGNEFMMSAYENEDEWLGHSADGKVYAVLGKLHGTDFTDTPAATDGVFSADSLAAEAEDMLAEHPQILDVMTSHPESVVEFLKRTGLDEKIESARLSGLQKAKDKELAKLADQLAQANLTVTELSDKNAELQKRAVEEMAAHDAEIEAKFSAQIESLSNQLKETESALASVTAEREQLSADLKNVQSDLAETREHLKAWQTSASAHGSLVNTPPAEPVMTYADARAQMAKLPPSKRAAFYKAHKAEIDGIKK